VDVGVVDFRSEGGSLAGFFQFVRCCLSQVFIQGGMLFPEVGEISFEKSGEGYQG
jgi:hypothetical protein